MFEITCRCGASKKNFKIDIGSFFINDCCEKAGFDSFGKTAEDYKFEAKEIVDQILEQAPKSKAMPLQAQPSDFIEEYSDEPILEEPKMAEPDPAPLKTVEELEKLSVRDIKDYLSAHNIPFKKNEKDKAKLLAHLK